MGRNTLAKYYGEEVWVMGIYDGPPIGHEKPVSFNYKTHLSKNERSRGLIRMSDIQPELKMGLIKKEKASCLKNVRGINGYEDIIGYGIAFHKKSCVITQWCQLKDIKVTPIFY